MKKTILVIEDDQFIREAIQELLESEDYAVLTARNGQEAMDALHEILPLPDAILLDLMMPVMDGFGFRSRQLADPRLRSIPVIIMSADGNVEEKTRRTDAIAYLKKPVELEDVLSTLRDAVKNPPH